MACLRVCIACLVIGYAGCASNPSNPSCTSSASCLPSETCTDGFCVPRSGPVDMATRDALVPDMATDMATESECGEPCDTGAPCEIGRVDCSRPTPRCVGAGPQPAGTVCREAEAACDTADTCDGSSLGCANERADVGTPCPGGFCDGAGECGECTEGAACTTSGCEVGTLTCSPTGEPTCVATGNAPDGTSCGDDVEGAFGECVSDSCGTMGTRTRTIERSVCRAGVCTVESSMDSQTCERDPAGAVCGESLSGEWSACTAADVCATSGTQTRMVVEQRCASGSCMNMPRTEMQACTRVTDGTACGSDGPPGPWSECMFMGCGLSGTQTREVTTGRCSAGSCGTSTRTETQSCSRPTAEGGECGEPTFGDFGATCLYLDCDPDMGQRFRSVTRRVCNASNVCADMSGVDSEECPPGGDVTGSFCSPSTGTFGNCAGPFNCQPTNPF
ncbi:MAG: hypothetical protein AAF938_00515 [Myxococcota bacterium]